MGNLTGGGGASFVHVSWVHICLYNHRLFFSTGEAEVLKYSRNSLTGTTDLLREMPLPPQSHRTYATAGTLANPTGLPKDGFFGANPQGWISINITHHRILG